MKAIKKPIPVDAWQICPDYPDTDAVFLRMNSFRSFGESLPEDVSDKLSIIFKTDTFYVETLEGKMAAKAGDYIVKGNHNDVWVVKKTIFENTYEVV